jgi:putative membrane protein
MPPEDPPRPDSVFDEGLQHERTALAWERTAIASMVAGVLLARYATASLHFGFAAVGLAQVVAGGALLLWSARHYNDLHGPLRAGESPIHPTAARVVGLSTICFIGMAMILSVLIAAGA